jgi:hypothetical protein
MSSELALKGHQVRPGSAPNLLIGSLLAGPFRAKRLFPLTLGKPWAKLYCPFGAGPSGHKAGANQIQVLTLEPWAL